MYSIVADWIAALDAGVSDYRKSDLVGRVFHEATIRRKLQETQSGSEGDIGDSDKNPKAVILSKEQCVTFRNI